MSFAWPLALSLALLPLAAAILGLLWKARAETLQWPAIIHGLIVRGRPRLSRPMPRSRRALPWRLVLAVLLVIAALARPQWGQTSGAEPYPSGEVLIALDLSHSMLAEDLPPSRLVRARGVAHALLDTMPEQKIGLIGFAGSAYLFGAPDIDQAVQRAYLADIAPDHFRDQGTDFRAMLDLALGSFSNSGDSRTLVLLSDGEGESPQVPIDAVRKAGIHIVSVAFGSAEGAGIPAAAGPLRDRSGDPVHTRLEPEILRRLAQETGGTYLGPADHARVVEATASALRSAANNDKSETVGKHELFVWFLGAAMLALWWSMLREWPAWPRLKTRRLPAAIVAPVLAIIAAMPSALHSSTQQPALDLQEERAPLERIRGLVAKMIVKPAGDVTADDYRALAEATVRYGEVHRGHAHPVAEGVLQDGLSAIRQGRMLDTSGANWDALETTLYRLLEQPPPVPEQDRGEADPANEPLDGRRQMPIPDRSDGQGQSGEGEPGEPDPAAEASQGDMRLVGGRGADRYDPEEWRNPSLVEPLHTLERLRQQDSPAEMFRLMQDGQPAPPAREQFW